MPLSQQEIAVVKGMILRGDRQHDQNSTRHMQSFPCLALRQLLREDQKQQRCRDRAASSAVVRSAETRAAFLFLSDHRSLCRVKHLASACAIGVVLRCTAMRT